MRRGIDRSAFVVTALMAALTVPGATASAQSSSTPISAASAASAATTAAPRVDVKRLRVNGNTLLPAATLDAALAPFTGPRTVDELKQAASEVQSAYGRAGYGGVVAFLPEQAPVDGVVTIEVVEGKLSRVTVTGNQQFSEANIRASLPTLSANATPRLTAIDAQIQLANESPAKQVQVLLQPGELPGQVDAKVTVVEQPVQRFTLGLDNTGNDRTGDTRASVGWQQANLFGRDHVASLQYQTSVSEPSRVKVLTGGYRVPFYAQGLVLDTYAAYSDVDGGNTATVAGNLTFAGRGRVFGARLSSYLPRLGDWDQRVAVGLDHRAYLNTCSIEGLGEVCGPAGESVAVQPLSVEYTVQRGGPVAFGLNVSLVHNLQLGGGNSSSEHFQRVRDGAKPRYTALRAGAFNGLSFAEDWQLRSRLNAQATRDALVPGEQFGIGGAASVRGYEERELAGDSGVSASIELITPELARLLGSSEGNLRLLAFVDGGWVTNQRDTPCLVTATGLRDRCAIGSAGIGARLQWKGLQASVYMANAFKTAARTERHDTRTHFAVSYSF